MLDLRVEILHAEAEAIEAQFLEQVNAIGIHGARVDLDRELALVRFVEREGARELRHQVAHLAFVQVGRRAATEVQLLDLARPVEQA